MFLKRKIILKTLGAFFGGGLGLLYWYFVGCEDGCTIQSVWWRMSLWGTVMGFLTTSIILDFLNSKITNKN